MKYRTLLLLGFLLTAFLILKPKRIMEGDMLYPGVGSDDYCYLAHATAMVFGEWPSYAKEKICRSEMPMASVGPALLSLPFVFPFSLIDRIEKSPIVNERNDKEVDNTWTAFGFAWASTFYFALAVLLLFLGLRFHFSERSAALTTFFMLLIQGAPLNAYRRPVFSHSYELFTQTAMVFLGLFLAKKGKIKSNHLPYYLATGVLCGLMALIRYNNLVYALVWPLVIAYLLGDLPRGKQRLKTAAAYAMILGLFFIFKVYPGYILGSGEKYASTVQGMLFIPSLSLFLSRLRLLVFGLDWGLIFTMPYFLAGLVYLAIRRSRVPLKEVYFLPFCVWLLFFIPTLNFGSNGGWYGYRYLFFSGAPLLAIPLADLLDSKWLAPKRRWHWALWIWAIVPLLSMLAFEGDDSLLLKEGPQSTGRIDYGCPGYQLIVWQHVLHPASFIGMLSKGGPAYVIYLLASLVGLQSHLPAVFHERYPHFSLTTFIRWILFLGGPTWLLATGLLRPQLLRLPKQKV